MLFFELSVHNKNPEKKNYQHNCFQLVSSAANQHIRMISEGSCDTEDWSNDAFSSLK